MIKTLEILFAIILTSIVLSGCSKTTDTDTAKTGNVNQPPPPSSSNVSINSPNTSAQTSAPNASTPPVSKQPSPAAKTPTQVIGAGGDDMFLFTQARLALSSDQELLNSVIIEIKEGNAVLSGGVSSEAQKKKALQLVQSIKGIKSVKNNIRVSS